MKKRILTFVYLFTLMTALFAVGVSSAAEAMASGKCGDKLTWTLYDNSELVIEGKGKMDHYSKQHNISAPWHNVRHFITRVTILNGVSSIGNYAFSDCANLTSITISDSVSTIGEFAFNDCRSLTGISIPGSVWSIGAGAFNGCRNLTSLIIPSSVTSIGHYVISGCRSLTSITIPGPLTHIQSEAFSSSALTSVTILSRDADFGQNVFESTPDSLTLYGYAGSTTEAYATENGHNFTALEEEPSFTHGDISGDGALDINDAISLFRYNMMPALYPISYEGDMDFTKDGTTDIADVILLFRHTMMPNLYPID